jgi:hypothetical protein
MNDEISSKLLSPQIPHVNHLIKCLTARTVIVDGSEPGTGKTYCAAAVCAARGLRPLIAAPKQSIPMWYDICAMFGVDPLGVVNYETLKNGRYYESVDDFYLEQRVECPYIKIERKPILNRNGLPVRTKGGQIKTEVKQIIWDLPADCIVIFDEAHRGKNGLNGGQTLNSELMVSVRPYLNRSDRKHGMILSATLTDKPENFDTAGYILELYKPHVRKVYEQFITRVSRANGGNIMLGFHKILYPAYGGRMTKAAIKAATGDTIFKNNIIRAKAYNIDTATALKIEYLHQEIAQTLKDIRIKGMSRGFGYVIRCWQKIEALKVPAAAALIRKQYWRGRSVVIFCCFKATKREIYKDINAAGQHQIPLDQIGYIDGDQNALERERVVKDFRADKLRVLVCQIVAGGESLSFHDINGVHQRYTILFPSWSAISMAQALGRIDRANAKSDAIQTIFYIKPVVSGFGKKEPDNIKDLLTDLDNEEAPDFEEAMLQPGDATPEMLQMIDISRDEQAHLSMEEKICQCVNAKINNIDMLNNGVLTGESIFGN